MRFAYLDRHRERHDQPVVTACLTQGRLDHDAGLGQEPLDQLAPLRRQRPVAEQSLEPVRPHPPRTSLADLDRPPDRRDHLSRVLLRRHDYRPPRDPARH
jgi:hypothetical protein